jgi:hypothetical protein
MKKLICLKPSQSKRLIAILIARLPMIREKFRKGNILVTKGTTQGYVLEELIRNFGIEYSFKKANFVAGQIIPTGENDGFGWLSVNPIKWSNIHFKNGELIEVQDIVGCVQRFKKGDIVIKGGNALDYNGNVGVFLGNKYTGGSIGSTLGIIKALGLKLVIPITLEKLITGDVIELSEILGFNEIDDPGINNFKIGMMPISGMIMNEVTALESIYDVNVYHIGSGGVGGMEGAITLLIEGGKSVVEEISVMIQILEHEPNFIPNRP